MKKLIYIAGGLLILLLAIYIGGKAFANNKLDSLIEKSNQNGNSLSVGERSLSFSFFNLGLVLDSVRLEQTAGNRRISGAIDHVDINGLSVMKIIGGDIVIDDLEVDGANLEVRPVAKDTTMNSTSSGGGQNITFANLRLANGYVRIFDEDGNLKTEVLGLSSNGALDLPLAPAVAPKMTIKADSLFFPATDDTDQSISYLKIDVADRTLGIGAFRISPKQAVRPFLTSISYKRPWQALHVRGINLIGVPFDSLMAGGRSVFPEVNINSMDFDIFENPSLERDPAEPYKPFPVEMFRELGGQYWVQSLTVERANIAYGVHKQGAEKPDITFVGSIKAGNFSTWKQDEPAFAQIDCTFEKTSPLTVRFNFDQSGDGRDFTATGDLKEYDLPKVNPLMEVAASADIEKGHISHMTHDFSVRNGVSKGDLVLKYDHLELKVTGKGAWFKNLFEDIAIRDSNPRNDGELVTGNVYVEHEETRSFFNLYWKSLVAGMTSSAVGSVFTPEELDPE